MSFADRMRRRSGSIQTISIMVLLSNSVTSFGQAPDDAAPASGRKFAGVVADAEGKPVEKASIALLPPLSPEAQRTSAKPPSNEAIERAVTGRDGRFEISLSQEEIESLVRVNPWKASTIYECATKANSHRLVTR